MASATAFVPFPAGRLVGVGLIVFLANAALLVLQLVAGRLLAPFVGSSLETWTSVIGVFLTGIALGNALGGKLADRYPSPRTLAILLGIGALAALWMVLFPVLIAGGAYKAIPLGPRIPLLAFVLCLPAGFVLSLLTPLAIKLGLPDVSKTGRVAGLIFALSTLGCLLGNYLTGFVLMKTFTINTLVFISAGSLAVLALWTLVFLKPGEAGAVLANRSLASRERERPEQATPVADAPGSPGTSPHPVADAPGSPNPHAFSDIRIAYLIVFLASFGGMALELTASRVLAQYLGVSLFTWTGIIGVMLAGTALGNLTGGLVADRVNRPGSTANPRSALAGTLIVAAAGTVLVLLMMWYFSHQVFVQKEGEKPLLQDMSPILQVVITTFSLFFLPMYLLGMISPQVIRLAVPDVAHVGRVAGRVYAWSTTGAIVGTFAAGYVFLSTLGMNNTLLMVALILVLTSLLVAQVWNENMMLYLFSLVLGGVVGGFILNIRTGRDPDVVQYESNYYTITVGRGVEPEVDEFGRFVFDAEGKHAPIRVSVLVLDHLRHSILFPDRPDKLHYTHEYVQMEFLRGARATNPNPRVLVIGGGGYTFPRYAMEKLPETRMDVVEIDPGVTKVARKHLGLKDYEGMTIVHMDGRQFVAEKAEPGTYDLVIQDAVNDLSVPSHLMTKEYNEAVKRAMKPGGVYLLTVIDNVTFGELWKAAIHTLRETYPAENVCLLQPNSTDVSVQAVYVIYASDTPLDLAALERHVLKQLPEEQGFAAVLGGATAVGGGATATGPGGSLHALGAAAGADAVFEMVADRLLTNRIGHFRTRRIPEETLRPYLEAGKKIVLTDQFAPVDNLMAEVFRLRNVKKGLSAGLGTFFVSRTKQITSPAPG